MLIGMNCALTKPTRSSGGGGGGSTDPDFSSVTSLLHFDGNLTDQKGITWTAVGNAAATGTAKFGSNALACDGAGDYITTGATTPLVLDSTDFTVECWVKYSGTSVYVFMCTQWTAGGGFMFSLNHVVANKLTLFVYQYSNAAPMLSSTTSLTEGEYHHVAFTRQGTTWRLYLDGTKEAEIVSGALIANSVRSIGAYFDGTGNNGLYSLNGTIDDVRITKGVARYTGATYTVPTAAFPDA